MRRATRLLEELNAKREELCEVTCVRRYESIKKQINFIKEVLRNRYGIC